MEERNNETNDNMNLFLYIFFKKIFFIFYLFFGKKNKKSEKNKSRKKERHK